MEEVGFADQFVESDTELIEKMEVVAKDIPILVDVGIEVDFRDHLVGFNMKIVEHLFMNDLVVVGDELCVAEHVVVRNEIASVVILTCVDKDLHIAAHIDFFVVDVKFVAAGVDLLVTDVDEGLFLK